MMYVFLQINIQRITWSYVSNSITACLNCANVKCPQCPDSNSKKVFMASSSSDSLTLVWNLTFLGPEADIMRNSDTLAMMRNVMKLEHLLCVCRALQNIWLIWTPPLHWQSEYWNQIFVIISFQHKRYHLLIHYD